MKKFLCLLLALTLLLGLTACGGASKNESMVYMESAAAAPSMGTANDVGLKTNGSRPSDSVPQGRKWIITVDMSVETENLEELQAALSEKILGMDGYIEDQSIYNGSAYANRRHLPSRV